jgi:hypothetical protein
MSGHASLLPKLGLPYRVMLLYVYRRHGFGAHKTYDREGLRPKHLPRDQLDLQLRSLPSPFFRRVSFKKTRKNEFVHPERPGLAVGRRLSSCWRTTNGPTAVSAEFPCCAAALHGRVGLKAAGLQNLQAVER